MPLRFYRRHNVVGNVEIRFFRVPITVGTRGHGVPDFFAVGAPCLYFHGLSCTTTVELWQTIQ